MYINTSLYFWKETYVFICINPTFTKIYVGRPIAKFAFNRMDCLGAIVYRAHSHGHTHAYQESKLEAAS